MTREEALDVITRFGAKQARIEAIRRKQAELTVEETRLNDEMNAMRAHAANTSEALAAQ